jgi:hypothetical protein
VNGDQVEALDVLVITEPDGSAGTESRTEPDGSSGTEQAK